MSYSHKNLLCHSDLFRPVLFKYKPPWLMIADRTSTAWSDPNRPPKRFATPGICHRKEWSREGRAGWHQCPNECVALWRTANLWRSSPWRWSVSRMPQREFCQKYWWLKKFKTVYKLLLVKWRVWRYFENVNGLVDSNSIVDDSQWFRH